MSEDAATCLICGEHHVGASDPALGCPTMKSVQAKDARPGNVPPDVYTGYLDAREALRGNSPRVAVKGLRKVLSLMAESHGARADAGFSEKLEKLCAKDVIGVRIRDALLQQALSEKFDDAHAWALMSLAEHAFYKIYMHKSSHA